MALPGEVEFFVDDVKVLTVDEDAVDLGQGVLPRWAVGLAGALLAVAFVTVAVSQGHPRPTTAAVDEPVATAGVPGEFGQALPLDGGAADALDVLVHRDTLYVLRSGGVTVLDRTTGSATSVQLSGAFAIGHQPAAKLVLDADADRLWVLGLGARTSRLIELNTGKLLPIRGLTVHLTVQGAAAMDGHLYLATPAGLADLAPAASGIALLPTVRGAVSAVTADPARNRLLVLDASVPGAVVVVSAGRATTRRAFGNLIKGSIAVVGDQIWVGGYGGGARAGYRAIVARLDPVTLSPVQTSSVALKVDRVDVAPGASNIWVTTSRPGLWCVDARTGAILEEWPGGVAPVTSTVGAAYAIDSGSVVPLILQGCGG